MFNERPGFLSEAFQDGVVHFNAEGWEVFLGYEFVAGVGEGDLVI